MKKRIMESMKMDNDERTDGQGFVLVGEPITPPEDQKETVTKEPERNTTEQRIPPVTEKLTDNDEGFFNQFNNDGGNDGTPPPTYGYGGNSNGSNSNKKKSSTGSRNVLIIILALLVGLGGGFGGGALAVKYLGAGSGSGGSNYTISAVSDELTVTEAVAEKVLPSVVGITATTTVATQDWFYGMTENETSGVGSGLIVDKAGYILTNSHVIMDDDKTKLTVLLSDGREVEGTVEWFDVSLDLAIVKIAADNLTAVDLGDSDTLKVGQYVAAIGNPLGLEFQGSVTQGVVSGLDRTITAMSDNKQVTMENLIQVDAAINSGNSGGPLLDSKGQVIGINTAKTESAENMGFAIPINTAKPIIESIKESGEYSRAYMGVSVTNVSDVAGENQNVDLGTDKGAYIAQVTQGSPAEAAGLQAKDIVVEVDGNSVESRNDLINLLLKYSAGDTISVKYYRDGKVNTAKVKLTGDIQG